MPRLIDLSNMEYTDTKVHIIPIFADKNKKELFYFCFYILLFPFLSCSENKSDVRAVCEKDASGNYLIKWETFPTLHTKVRIYESESPDEFVESQKVMELSSSEAVAYLPSSKDALSRKYFKLTFGRKAETVVSNRVVDADKLYNFRDIGGYYTRNKEQLKWGMIYRSSSLAKASDEDDKVLDRLGIKTIIDLRTDSDAIAAPVRYQARQYFRFPLRGLDLLSYFRTALRGELRSGDALIRQQDYNVALIKQNKDYLIKYFDLLLNEDNYPILAFGELGKDRVGIFSYLTLCALGVTAEQIYEDYTLSNSNINVTDLIPGYDKMPIDTQESLAALLYSNERVILYIRKYIADKYGSEDEYLKKELGLTSSKREKLKELMLYEKNN